ncbi:MAG: hypothetical protein A2857_07010 [Candidatus Levybacteria bacterium RIFCSPHIGHO2_01_FULL_36_15]|nr:MAG: hypothetical protein A2857_07010 [Candidatus Levybacteria bacterium RIFCSPHIGHO2_01_FULL_36_15]
MAINKLNQYASFLIKTFEGEVMASTSRGITVNPIISEIASWYERLRNAMDIREEEVILRAAIERILKRRLILGGNGKKIASPLIRELIWARYFPDGSVPEKLIEDVAKTIDLHLALREHVLLNNHLKESDVNKWFYHLMSSKIEQVLNPNKEKEAMVNFMFHVLRDNIIIKDDTEEEKDIQTLIAIRKAYAKDDLAFLRYHLFVQYFGNLSEKNINNIANNFNSGFFEIEKQLIYPLRYKIYTYVKKQSPPFFILDDVLRSEKQNIHLLINDEEKLKQAVYFICQKRYDSITSRVQQAIVKSIIFIILTKALIALAVEGTYENLIYGKVIWKSIALNVMIPPFLMIIATAFIKTPTQENSKRIYNRIQSLLFNAKPSAPYPVVLKLFPDKTRPFIDYVFGFLWFAAFFLSFGVCIFLLTKLHFNIVSQGVFLFFLAIVCFLFYRINRTAHTYTLETKQGLITPVIDFFLMPIVQVGRYLTDGISQINIILFVLDFIIETPFKGMFAFFEQWFLFLNTKREYLE